MSLPLCACGCGAEAVPGRREHATLLAEAKPVLHALHLKAKSGSLRQMKAQHLLWAWQRCERGLLRYVHGDQLWECGPPTPLWMIDWMKRAEEL